MNLRGRDHVVRAHQALLSGQQRCPVCNNALVVRAHTLLAAPSHPC